MSRRNLCFCAILVAVLVAGAPKVTAFAHAMTITGPTPSSFAPEDSQTTSLSFTPAEAGYYTVWVVNRFHDLGRVTYTNVYGSLDAVTYYTEPVKRLLASTYVAANTTKTVTWDGTATNGQKYQKGICYFKIIPDADTTSTQFKAVTVVLGSTMETWRAYIRQARTWDGVAPYLGGGISREPGRGVDCTGFVITSLREMGYSLPQPQCTVDGIYNLWSSSYRTITSYANIKQGDLFAWCDLYGEGDWDHTTLYTYSSGTTKYQIDSSGAENGVKERPIPTAYCTNVITLLRDENGNVFARTRPLTEELDRWSTYLTVYSPSLDVVARHIVSLPDDWRRTFLSPSSDVGRTEIVANGRYYEILYLESGLVVVSWDPPELK